MLSAGRPTRKFGHLITPVSKAQHLCLITVNSAWYQSSLALRYLRNCLKGLPLRVKLLEFTTSEPLFEILARIASHKAGIYCFSAYVWNRSMLQALLPELAKLQPQSRIVLGGPDADGAAYGLRPQDYVVKGPGEGALRHLADSAFTLPGGEIEHPAPPLRELPFPYRAADKPALRDRLVYYETFRGCPFRCAYCLSATDDRHEPRFDVSQATDRRRLRSELHRLLSFAPRTIKFVDRSFNINTALARYIWRFAIGLESSCEWHFEIYPELLSEEDIELLSQAPAGRIRLETGIQTVNRAVNQACGRRSDWPKARAMLLALQRRTQVSVHADLLAGLPGETLSSVLHSLDELAACLPHEIQLGTLKILSGTPMQAIARQRGYIWMDSPPWQVLASDRLSFAQMATLQDLARIINLYWNKGEFRKQWSALLAEGHRASQLFLRLLARHREQGLQLHSISARHRAEVFASCFAAGDR
ncbi:MAG TPA: DUF4080 domain-containing protein [Candidatus Cloacimonadota bacterium]|nr:DUF4080 domain-containing protein [Candidatus Cloacimonadota bacterium]HQL13984.1 DUF4080 domain-containing protein [Candidatus Cloacimonadota bacterium]HQP18472.1 DUF4080 domain-containing protein [Candidatus Cloacimonadota bacterium]HRS50561.1 DUF4080 domain-containing protein [Candidatus Cloacimonadota bacterium]